VRKNFAAWLVLIALLLNLNVGLNISKAEQYNVPVIDSDSAVLMDARTGQILFAKNKDKKQFPASITKVMTGMLALENADIKDTITMSRQAVFSIERGSSHIALDTDEKLSLEDALYALSIESANDAGNGIAEYIAGDSEGFAELMNKRARELGALNTHFVNAHGLDDPSHYTTAYDMALIMRQAIKTPHFKEIFTANYYKMPPTNLQAKEREFHSKNLLLNGSYEYEGITASKLGWTSKANNTLVTSASRDGRDLIVVVMNSTGHRGTYLDTMKLFDYGFNEFQEVVVLSADVEKSLPLSTEKAADITVKTDEDITRLLHKSVFPDSVQASYEILEGGSVNNITTKVSFQLPQKNTYMYEDLGSITIDTPVTAPANTLGSAWGMAGSIFAAMLQGIKIILVILLTLAVLILILRQINQARLRKKRMARRQNYRIDYIQRKINTRDNEYYHKYDDKDFNR